ncbi:MAG TPA: hypothetical protein VFY25_14925 [Anaerolineales bacterium]|nr:hypothetical protein [Anaerolineales bacterium]
MTLDAQDGRLFFDLMWKLQFFVNQKRGFHPNISSEAEYANLPTEDKLKARDALWEDPGLIAAYVQDNPDALPPDSLQIVERWQGFVKGSFFILRHLKKGSIFIGKDDGVYAVHGILDPLEEVIPSYALPQMVEAVLLPFKGKIIYDGLLSGYSIHFGGGIRSNLNRVYMAAKENTRIISSLEPDLETPGNVELRKSITPQLNEIAEYLAKVKGQSPLQKSALALARLSIELSLADENGTLVSTEIEKRARKIFKASERVLEVLDRKNS